MNFESMCKKYHQKSLDINERDTLREENTYLYVKAHKKTDIYLVDNGIIPRKAQNQSACDFLLYSKEGKTSKFIELKGIDVVHACEQIHDTVKYFEDTDGLKEVVHGMECIQGYIVSPHSQVPSIDNMARKKACRKLHAKSKSKNKDFLQHIIFIKCVNKVVGNYRKDRKNNEQLLVCNEFPLEV